MSHHIDTQEALKDSRLDLADVYVFDAQDRQHTAFILTVNPFAGSLNPEPGAQQPGPFHPDAMYELKLDLDVDVVEDVSYRFTFGAPDAAGEQHVDLRRTTGPLPRVCREEQVCAMGTTGATTLLH